VRARGQGGLLDAALLGLAFALPLSIAASEILLGLAIVAWLWTAPWREPRPAGWRMLATATGLLAATWILASLCAADPWASLVKARKLYSIVIVFLVADRARDARQAGRLAGAALLGGAVSAGLGLGGVIADRLAGTAPDERMRGVFSTAMTSGNVYAMLALAALGMVLLGGRPRSAVAGPAAAFGLLALALVRTLTRSSWLAFLAGGVVLLARTRPRWLLAGLALLALLLAFGPVSVRERARTIVDPTWVTNQGRISLWKSGLAVVADHPWTGVGLADHSAVIARYRRPDATFPAGHFHNNLVQVAASTGWIGFAAYLAWMALVAGLLVTSLRGGWGGWALTALAVWVAFQVHGLFDWSFGDAEVANQFFLWIGLGLAPQAGPFPPENPAISPSPASPSVPPLSGPAPAA
jgi:O-antigen ligase